MDDDHTQQTLDDLADLFLTGTAPQPPRRDPGDGPEPVRLRPSFASKPVMKAQSETDTPVHHNPEPEEPESAEKQEVLGTTPATALPAESLREAQHKLRLTPAIHQFAVHQTNESEAVNAQAESGVGKVDDGKENPLSHVAVMEPSTPHEPAHHEPVPDDDQDWRQPAEPLAVRPHIEAVLLGNLPGLAHAWLTQYAQLLAQRDGPVLLLTVDDDTPGGVLEAELIEPALRDVLRQIDRNSEADDDLWDDLLPRRDATASSRTAPSSRHTARDIRDVLDELLYERDVPIATVLIYTDTAPSQIDRLLDVGVWTLLTGADETAVVAGYRGLKSLADADVEAPGASVGVFVMGSPDERSTKAAQKIATACDELFDTPIESLGHLQKMRPAAVRTLGRFADLDRQWNDLLDALAELPAQSEIDHAQAFTEVAPGVPAEPEPKREPAATPKTHPTRQANLLPPAFASALLSNGIKTHTPTQPPRVHSEAQDDEARPAFVSSVEARHEPTDEALDTPDLHDPTLDEAHVADQAQVLTPALQDAEATTHSAAAPDLPALLTVAIPSLDLKTLPAHGPDHPDIDLALDADGQLHLLARLQDAEHPRAALLELCDARRWAVRHRHLLRLAAPANRALDPSRTPAVHLFTHQPDQAVPLAATIDPNIRLHLLQHLPLAAGPTWLATPLQSDG